TGSNLSGTNTGDQTISLTGDVVGTGTGTFATTIQADAVALTTDTTGNYVQSITNGFGITGGNGGSEGAALTLGINLGNSLTVATGLQADANGLSLIETCTDGYLLKWTDVGGWACQPDIDTSGGVDNYWTALAGVLSPNGTDGEVIAATSAATTVGTFTTTGDANALAFKAGGITNFVTIDKEGDLVASGNISANNLSGTNTGDVTLAGTPNYLTILNQEITLNKLDLADDLNTFSSANLSGLLTDETGTGVAVFGTSPAITTSLTTGSTSFDLLNTTATTINFGGAASTLNIGPGAATATSVNIAGGSAATGCTVDGSNGNLTCSGDISATGTVTGSNLSGTNTGDQTISLTGDVVGTGTGTFATTIQADAVALT
ncbi:MAG: hypothetical protein LC655_08505, partial [Bacteroidales bacterium]|nr:hypothetical protein [Bacteroidales bacterium]